MRTRSIKPSLPKKVSAAAALALSALFALAAPAQAAGDGDVQPEVAVICDAGTVDLTFNTWSSSRTITHDKYISVPAGGSVDVVSSVTKIATITASVTYSTSATVSASAVMADFSGTVGVTLAASGSVTYQGTESVTYHLVAGQYAVFHGEKKFNGGWSGWKCNSFGTSETAVSGNAVSWAVPGEGAASCSGSYSSTSFEYRAQQYAC